VLTNPSTVLSGQTRERALILAPGKANTQAAPGRGITALADETYDV